MNQTHEWVPGDRSSGICKLGRNGGILSIAKIEVYGSWVNIHQNLVQIGSTVEANEHAERRIDG